VGKLVKYSLPTGLYIYLRNFFFLFLARDVIYTSRAYAMMPVSVCLSVCLWRLCIVVTGCNGYQISLHAWIDGCLCYLLTTPHPDRWMGWCQDFWWKTGNMEKFVFVAISLNLLTDSLDRKHVTLLLLFIYERCWYLIWFCNLMHYIWRTVCARASHISRYASHC